jgi:hypothetical protein
MLEDTVEQMSTTLVGLSDSILASEYIRSHPQLITSVRASVQRALTLAENATREADEENESDDDDQESRQDQAGAPAQAEQGSGIPSASGHGEGATAARFPTRKDSGLAFEAAPSNQVGTGQRNPVPDNVRGMPTQNAFFTREFWGGDYSATTRMHMVERPNQPLPFWDRLLRLNPTSVIHRLTRDGMRGDEDVCTRWEARGFRCSLRHKSKANVLARTRWVIDGIAAQDARVEAMQKSLVGRKPMQASWRPCVEAYFDNEDLRAFGAATMYSMVLAGYPVQNLINTEEVESYLKERGTVQGSKHEMQLELKIPVASHPAVIMEGEEHFTVKVQRPTAMPTARPRRSRPSSGSMRSLSQQRRPRKRMVTVNLHQLIEQFINLSICTGSGIACILGRI